MLVKNTKIPEDKIPLVALHWGNQWWYGSKMSPLDMRKFFERRLRNAVETKEVVDAWIMDAEGWKIISDYHCPGVVEQQLAAFHSIKLAA
ncbi:MAG: hypothetical protein WDZ56_01495 [Candidatus Paceibacterota bacterium]